MAAVPLPVLVTSAHLAVPYCFACASNVLKSTPAGTLPTQMVFSGQIFVLCQNLPFPDFPFFPQPFPPPPPQPFPPFPPPFAACICSHFQAGSQTIFDKFGILSTRIL